MDKKQRRRWRALVIISSFILIYAVTVVPVGLFIYTLKSDLGFNAFRKGGYHTYLQCLAVSVELADMPKKPVQ